MSRAPQQTAAEAAASAGVDWGAALKRLLSSSHGAATPGSPLAAASGVAVDPSPRLWAAASAPKAVQSARPGESACCLLALRICPDLAAAWLQWGGLLYAWTKETRHAAKLQAAAAEASAVSGPSRGSASSAAGPALTDLEGYGAAAEAFCEHLRLDSDGGATGEGQLPLILKLLQLTSSHGGALEPRLSAALRRCPPLTWRPAVPQLIAQLLIADEAQSQQQQRDPPSDAGQRLLSMVSKTASPQQKQDGAAAGHRGLDPAARAMILEQLHAVAAAAPFAVVYPCVMQARVAEASGRRLVPELQVGSRPVAAVLFLKPTCLLCSLLPPILSSFVLFSSLLLLYPPSVVARRTPHSGYPGWA